MWFKQGISLDDSNFDMENYSSLVDVKLLSKRVPENYWNKLICKFCIIVRCVHARARSSTCATNQKCNNGPLTPKSVVQLTAFIAFETGRKLNPACCNYVDFSKQPLISVAQKRSFPKSNNSHTMHRFILFMGINKDDEKPVDIF